MLSDGLTLAAGSGLGVQMLDEARRGTAFPLNPVEGALWELTAQLPNQPKGIYEYTQNDWYLRSPQSSILSYDLSGTIFGNPEPGAKVLFFVAPRSFAIQGSLAGAIARALQPSNTQQEFSIIHTREDSSVNFVGRIVFPAGDTTAEFLSDHTEDIHVKRGETLVVFAPSEVDPALADISFTLCGFILA